MSLTLRIFLAMVLGVVVGATLFAIMPLSWVNADFIRDYFLEGVFWIGAEMFVASLKMLVVPLVFVSLVCGVTSMQDNSQLGRLGVKSIGLYLLTTAVAISIAISIALLVGPGEGANLTSSATFEASEGKPVKEVIAELLPSNPIWSMANGIMLQVIVFAILLGVALTRSGEAGKRIADQFNDWNEVIMKLLGILINFAPYGVFCLLVRLFADSGLSRIGELGLYFICVVVALLVHATIVYPSLLVSLGRLNPFVFLSKMGNTQMFAFSTSSSSATMPVTLRTVEKRLGVHPSVASFTVPMGATINMDGTAIMQGVATVFIAQAFNVDIGLTGYLTVILMATMASIGTAGVPGVGLVTLSMVLGQVGLPVEGIALIIGVDRLLDMMRTAVNVTGDATVSCIVAKTEKQLDEEIFYDPEAGKVVEAEDDIKAEGEPKVAS